MRRREFLALLGGITVTLPAMGQHSGRTRHVAVLTNYAESDTEIQVG